MLHKKSTWWTTGLLVLAVLILVQACSISGSTPTATEQPVTATEQSVATDSPPPVIVHTIMPVDLPGSHWSSITDRDSSVMAAERRANGGENFIVNLYERPFNADTMDTYFPDLDITGITLSNDGTWFFVSMQLAGTDSATGLMTGNYGVELDLDVDGRGDYLIFAANPDTDWSTDGVRVWTDSNNDVGGNYPMQAEEGMTGDGYETVVFDSGVGSDPDTAWARISPTSTAVVEIAFKSALVNDDAVFTWGGWTDHAVLNPAWYDYNDHFTAEQIGSPLLENTSYYPIKILTELDNTCRWAVGFNPTGSEPGICPVPVTPTPKPPTGPGTISGRVYYNGINGGLSYVAGTSIGASGIPVTLRSGSCGGAVVSTVNTGSGGSYSFSVGVGTYCVSASTPSSHQTGAQTVTVPSGGSASADFFYYTYLGMR